MVKQYIPSFIKQKFKSFLGIASLQQKIDVIQQDFVQCQTELNQLKALYNYSVLKEVDLVRYYGDLYFWYTQDISYQWISRSPEPLVIKNYVPIEEDFIAKPSREEYLKADYQKLDLNRLHIHEQELKQPLFFYLWLNNIDFVFVDIGANVGNTAIPIGKFFKQYNKSNPIISFEPGVVYDLLQHSLRINGLYNLVRVENYAVGDHSGSVVIKSLLQHSECNSIQDFRKFYPDLSLASCHLAECVRLDDYIEAQNIQNPLVVKIDAEGSDWQVLQGLSRIIPQQVVILIIEYDPKYFNEFISPEELFIPLNNDYQLLNMRTLDQSLQWKYSEIGDTKADFLSFSDAVKSSPAGWTDILAIRRDLPNLPEFIQRLVMG